MKKFIFYLLFCILSLTKLLAECPHTFICSQQGCAKVTDTNCSLPEQLNSSQLTNSENTKLNSQGAIFVSPNNNSQINSKNNAAIPPTVGCAENGSCYGDTSAINGLPKTTQVDGYFRKDGTYVRGYYRSKGR